MRGYAAIVGVFWQKRGFLPGQTRGGFKRLSSESRSTNNPKVAGSYPRIGCERMRSETLSLIRRITLVIAVPAMTLLALAVMTSTATAAAHCHSVRVEGTKIRVAAVRTSCKAGREVASEYFERTLNGDHFDGKTGDGSIYYDVNGFRCLTGLGGSQMYCHTATAGSTGRAGPKTTPRPGAAGPAPAPPRQARAGSTS
jgi:hypothetical protein